MHCWSFFSGYNLSCFSLSRTLKHLKHLCLIDLSAHRKLLFEKWQFNGKHGQGACTSYKNHDGAQNSCAQDTARPYNTLARQKALYQPQHVSARCLKEQTPVHLEIAIFASS